MEQEFEQSEMLRSMEGMVSALNLELQKCKQDHKKGMLKLGGELADNE